MIRYSNLYEPLLPNQYLHAKVTFQNSWWHLEAQSRKLRERLQRGLPSLRSLLRWQFHRWLMPVCCLIT
jgi:hypothetical protein